jgi:signal transduction histidine kinase/ActR/RegA family two-component response regulator
MIKIFIMSGNDQGQSYEVEGDRMTIGRGSGNEVRIRETAVSRNHLRIAKKGSSYLILDLNSTNGTFVKGMPITPGEEIEVEEGIPVTLGKTLISIGKECQRVPRQTVETSEEITFDPFDTAKLTTYQGRPMTTPKNLEFIYKVANILMQSMDINEILEKMLDYIYELLKRIDRIVIVLTDTESGEVTDVISRSSDEDDEPNIIYSRHIVNEVLKSGEPVFVLDTFDKKSNLFSQSMQFMKVMSVMCVPLISKNEIRGVMYVDSITIPGAFRKADLSLLITFASFAAIAIENALLYANLEEIVDKRTKSLRETEKRLRESEARFKAMFNNMSSGVTVYKARKEGEDFVLLDINTSNRKIENIMDKDVGGKSVLEVFPEARELGLMDIFRRVWKTGMPEQRTINFSRGDEVPIWREYYVYRLPSKEIVAIFDDLTDKKKVEAEQKALQQQFLASQKMESIGTFAGGTAHNFRNILQVISGNIEYLELMHKDNPDIGEMSKNILDSIEKGVDMINNLLHFSRREKVSLVNMDLKDIILKSYKIINNVFKKNIEISLELEDDLFVKGDQSLLSQGFMNLFTNARDAMPGGGRLLIKAKRTTDSVIASVSDTGYGIDKESLDKVFDPFFTLKDVGQGTGLGLSTTHGIVEQHNGKITVSSIPDQGTTFTITLPLAADGGEPVAEVEKDLLIGHEQTVLILDDEQAVLITMSKLIKSLGYKVISSDRPAEVLENYARWAPDVLLIDRNMPTIDGVDCIKKILEMSPDARIVIISGYKDSGPDGIDEDVRKMIKGYLVKPCSAFDLSKTLSHVMED